MANSTNRTKTNNSMMFVGVAMAVVVFLVVFFLLTSQTDDINYIVVSSQDIAPGTVLTSLERSQFNAVPFVDNSEYSSTYNYFVTPEILNQLATGNGVFIKDVKMNAPILLSDIAADNNPLGVTNASLLNSVENNVNISINFNANNTPVGLSVGDHVNVILTVPNGVLSSDFSAFIPEAKSAKEDYENQIGETVSSMDPNYDPTGMDEFDLSTMTDEEIYQLTLELNQANLFGQYDQQELNQAEQLYNNFKNAVFMNGYVLGPYARTIVKNALVTGVACDYEDSLYGVVCYPDAISISVPDKYSETIAMADSAGILTVTISSKVSTADSYEPTTDGATLSEFIRGLLAEQGIIDIDSWFKSE